LDEGRNISDEKRGTIMRASARGGSEAFSFLVVLKKRDELL